MMFVVEGREQVEENLEKCRYTLQRRGMKVGQGKNVRKDNRTVEWSRVSGVKLVERPAFLEKVRLKLRRSRVDDVQSLDRISQRQITRA